MTDVATVQVKSKGRGGYAIINHRDFVKGVHELYEGPTVPVVFAPVGPPDAEFAQSGQPMVAGDVVTDNLTEVLKTGDVITVPGVEGELVVTDVTPTDLTVVPVDPAVAPLTPAQKRKATIAAKAAAVSAS